MKGRKDTEEIKHKPELKAQKAATKEAKQQEKLEIRVKKTS